MHLQVRNGMTMGYLIALVNAAFQVLTSFGIHISENKQAALVGFLNAAIILAIRIIHLPEAKAAIPTATTGNASVTVTPPTVTVSPGTISTESGVA